MSCHCKMFVYYLVIQYKKQTQNKQKTKQSKTKHTQNIRCKCISCCNLVDLLYVVLADVSRLVIFSVSKIIFKLK